MTIWYGKDGCALRYFSQGGGKNQPNHPSYRRKHASYDLLKQILRVRTEDLPLLWGGGEGVKYSISNMLPTPLQRSKASFNVYY